MSSLYTVTSKTPLQIWPETVTLMIASSVPVDGRHATLSIKEVDGTLRTEPVAVGSHVSFGRRQFVVSSLTFSDDRAELALSVKSP